jgi:predicted porin
MQYRASFNLEENNTMQKKLIAVAVAGALAAPAAALAQSTVQLYGNIYMEYAFTSTGANTANTVNPANVDTLQAPGSAIGFRGEEKLGGGMSAWFQCESSADYRGTNGDGFCTRNSAVGVKGGFGNFFIGIWDTPFKRTIGNVGGRDTGIYGTADLLTNNSTSTSDGASAGVFKRRQRNSINYDSPRFGGFQVMAAFSSTNSSSSLTTSDAGAKPRIWSLGGQYRAGPLELSAGWEQHTKAYPNGVAAAAGTVSTAGVAVAGTVGSNSTFAGDESGWHISGAYTLKNGLRLGATYTKQEADTAPGANAENTAYQLGLEWKISGPHNVHFGYTVADSSEGSLGAAMTGRPAVGAAANGAKLWQIRYLHDFSKRTVGSIGYVNLKNDVSGTYDLMGVSGTGTGAKSSAVALSIQHRF